MVQRGMSNRSEEQRQLSEVECAYLAGFFDADGAIMASIEKHSEKKFGFRVRLSIKITQKSNVLLDEIQQQLGCGHVRNNRGVHEYDIKDQSQVSRFIDLIYPYSRAKQTQLDLARKIAIDLKNVSSQTDLINVARLADSLAECNVRSKNRRKNYAEIIGLLEGQQEIV